MKFEFLDFPMYVKLANKSTKTGKPSYIRISGNSIYSGNIQKHVRRKVVDCMHEYIISMVKQQIRGVKPPYFVSYPVTLNFCMHLPLHYSSVRLDESGVPKDPVNSKSSNRFDLFNIAYLWQKCIEDCLVKEGIIEDDSVKYICKYSWEYKECVSIKDRKIVLTII